MRISDWSSDVCSSDLTHRAIGINLAPLVIEAMADLVPNDRPDRPIVDGVVDTLAKIGRLQYASREHDLVFEEPVIAVALLRVHRPFLAVRSEARRVGQECPCPVRSSWSP